MKAEDLGAVVWVQFELGQADGKPYGNIVGMRDVVVFDDVAGISAAAVDVLGDGAERFALRDNVSVARTGDDVFLVAWGGAFASLRGGLGVFLAGLGVSLRLFLLRSWACRGLCGRGRRICRCWSLGG